MDRDAKLIRDILLRGSKTAADELIRTHYDEIYIYAFRQCSNKDEALDLTQNIFIAALGSLHSFENRELSEMIEKYVSALDPAVQEIFRLRVYGDKTFPEIASLTGQPESKIKAIYYRLTSRLRKEFENDY